MNYEALKAAILAGDTSPETFRAFLIAEYILNSGK